MDFATGDVIDLSAIDANGAGVGEGAFTRVSGQFTAAGQLRVDWGWNSDRAYVYLNTDSDTAYEGVFRVFGNLSALLTDAAWVY
jgi:hypothetical protein